MDILEDMLVQDAVYWNPANNGLPDEGGQVTFEEPVQILCRWEDLIVEFLDREGNKTISRSVVYVDRDVMPLGVLWQGVLDDLDDETDPFANAGAFEVRAFSKIPTLDGDEFLRTAYL